jgi:hypothetical protein
MIIDMHPGQSEIVRRIRSDYITDIKWDGKMQWQENIILIADEVITYDDDGIYLLR